MIVIPMVGLSSRFFKAGYNIPKYMLQLGEFTVFEHSVSSFEEYFETHQFLFIVRPEYNTPDFVQKKATSLGIKDFSIVTLNYNTRGQAETVAAALKETLYSGPITIFNIDTFRPNFTFPENLYDGYLEVFEGTGANWSYVKPQSNNPTLVAETAEKVEISNLCCTGLYYFSSAEQFLKCYEQHLKLDTSEWQAGELYVAPLYNMLIKSGFDITYNIIPKSEVIFCGVPDEYEELKESFMTQNKVLF